MRVCFRVCSGCRAVLYWLDGALGGAGAHLPGISKVLKSVLAGDVVLLGFNYWSMYLSILGDQSLISTDGGVRVMCTFPSFGFGSSTSLLCLFGWFDSAPTLLVQVDWASGIALWVPTLSVKSLYNRSEYTKLFSLQGIHELPTTDLSAQGRSSFTEFRLGMRILDADAGIGRCCGHWELIGDIWISSELMDADNRFKCTKPF